MRDVSKNANNAEHDNSLRSAFDAALDIRISGRLVFASIAWFMPFGGLELSHSRIRSPRPRHRVAILSDRSSNPALASERRHVGREPPMGTEDQNWAKALDELRDAPVKQRSGVSLKSKIIAALDEILAFRRKGYSDADILDILKRNGVVTTIGTLRHYVGVAKRARQVPSNAKPSKRRTAKAEAKTRVKADESQTSAPRDVASAPEEISKQTIVAPRSKFPVSQPSKPARRKVKSAAEVLGHRLDETEL
jgi:hypothetical protein